MGSGIVPNLRPVIALVVAGLVVGRASAVGPPRPRFFDPVSPPRPVQVMAHRGLAACAPENSLAALQACVNDFIEWAEVDIRLTRDGYHVLIHDARLERTTNGRGAVADQSLAELRKLDTGAWFAPRFQGTRLVTLPEALAFARGRLNLYLDCKDVDPVRLVKEVRDARMEAQVILFGDPALSAKVRALSGGRLPTMLKYRDRDDLDGFVAKHRPTAVEIDADEVTADRVRRFHSLGVKVQAKVLGAKWDNPDVWDKVLAAGVDWVQTDDPVGVHFHAARKRLTRWPVQIAFHRGANRYAPENTAPAIRRAVALGADYVEIDIRTTRDGTYVLLHDGKLDRTTDGKGPVVERTAAEVGRLKAGAWFSKAFAETRVPTLDGGLALLTGKTAAYLDAKAITPEALLAAMRKHRLLERSVVYQSTEYLARLKRLEPRARALPPLRRADDLEKVAAIRPYGVDARWTILSAKLIKDCHAQGIKVFSDALGWHESVAEYRKAIGWGIDVIQTDHPARVLRAIELEAQSRSRP